MTDSASASVHATAVKIEDRAVLIRGPSGSGKSRLALDLILAGRAGQIPLAVLVGDDRVYLDPARGQLVVRAARELTGQIEVRGLGIRQCDFVREAVVGLVVDLGAEDASRLPQPESLWTEIKGVRLPRIPVGAGFSALPLVLAALIMAESSASSRSSADCSKGIGNHISPTIATE